MKPKDICTPLPSISILKPDLLCLQPQQGDGFSELPPASDLSVCSEQESLPSVPWHKVLCHTTYSTSAQESCWEGDSGPQGSDFHMCKGKGKDGIK